MRVTIRNALHWIEQCNGIAMKSCNFFVRMAGPNDLLGFLIASKM